MHTHTATNKQKVELIYSRDCPNITAARELLAQVLGNGATANWTEWDRNDEKTPAYARQYGSPTILVNGKDITGAGASGAPDCCRVYLREDGGFRGVPGKEEFLRALALL